MNPDTIYAVLDLETTGTSVTNGDRIIQIGCAFLQHGQVIDTYSQLINPNRDVPAAISALTHIHAADLVAAPYFEAVAPALYTRLQETVIVAHNVNFDYPFLSAEFERVGFAALTNPAVDTVELAQILLPTAESFRLKDLTQRLHIDHAHPHRADSDAVSTANLLVALTKRFQALPSVTQARLVHLGDHLTRQTAAFLTAHERSGVPIGQAQVVVDDLVLQQLPTASKAEAAPRYYPLTDKAKRALLAPNYTLRRGQAKLMDALYHNATVAKAPMMIEAGTGLGKTLAYLLSYAYVCDADHQLVVATTTTVLQAQLVQQVQAVAALMAKPLPCVVVQSPRHYLNLDAFVASLAMPEADRLTRLLQMKLVVWLCETTTGDLAELHLTNYKAPLFARIRASETPGAFGEYDFIARLKQAKQQATVIITNHAYLAHHAEALSQGRPYLIVDEAHRFADNVAAANSQTLPLAKLRQLLQHLVKLVAHPDKHDLTKAYADDALKRYQLQSLKATVASAIGTIEALQLMVYKRYIGHGTSGRMAQALPAGDAAWAKASLQAPIDKLRRQLDAVGGVCDQLIADFQAHKAHFGKADGNLFQALMAIVATLHQRSNDCGDFAALQLSDQAAGIMQLTLSNGLDPLALTVEWERFAAPKHSAAVLKRFTAPVLLSATLMVQRSFAYALTQVGLPQTTATLQIRSPFHYKEQAQVFVDPQAPQPNGEADAYYDYLAKAIQVLAGGPHQTLVLFTSLSAIQAVYARLNNTALANHKEILAQGVNGSASKLAKRFLLGDNSLVLGAASFFEGIDYPAKLLEMVILTRLPFGSPTQPLNAARDAYIMAHGGDPFTEAALPEATLRLRQGFGRLIRTSEDRGVFVCLDPRLVSTKYGRQMQHALPNLKPMQLALSDIAAYSQAWLSHRPLQLKKEGAHASR